MEKRCQKNEMGILALIGVAIGCLFFVAIYGTAVLDVTYDDWLFSGEDITQHYFGWLYFRKSNWKFPIGMIEKLIDVDISIIFMDSIPLFALFFKVIEGFLPDTFQYFGIWGIFSYGMMGGLSSLLLYRFIKSKIFCLIGSIFFVASPYMLQRMYAHTALAGQWIIVLAILIWIYNLGFNKVRFKIAIWTVTLCTAALVHIYFVPMIVVFLLFDAFRYYLNKKKILISGMIVLIPIMFALVTLYVVGAFSGTGAYGEGGLGYYSANVNSLFNSQNLSPYVPQLPRGAGQYEGFGYLGLGMLILLAIDAVLAFLSKDIARKILRNNILFLALSCIIGLVFWVLALSPTIMVGENVVLQIAWPQFIMRILGIFRASGRFIWVVGYMIFALLLILLYKLCNHKIALCIAIILCSVQIADMNNLMQSRTHMVGTKVQYQEKLDIGLLEQAVVNKEKLVFMPYNIVYHNYKATYALGKYCYENNLQFNSFYVSRPDAAKMTELTNGYLEAIKEGNAEEYLFVFYDKNALLDGTFELKYYQIGDIILGSVNDIESLETMKINQ